MLKRITKKLYQCVCDLCGHQWESDEIPRRCAKCKRHTWNSTDRRFKEPEKTKTT